MKTLTDTLRTPLRFVLPVLLLAAGAAVVGAQETAVEGFATQSLRPYWHVFAAYAIGVVLILGWVISMARRMKHLEDRLRD